MSVHKDIVLGETVYFWFAANDTSGSAGDGATPLYDVRLGGAAAGAAPVLSGTPTLLSHASYGDGLHEIAIAATSGNGFAWNQTYSVFATLTIDSQTPGGFVGSFAIRPHVGGFRSVVAASVDATVSPTTTYFETSDITEATSDHFKGRLVVFYDSGDALYRQMTKITAYALNGGRGAFTVEAMTEAPSSGDLFAVL